MHQIIKPILTASTATLLASCASYNLTPKYEESNKTVMLGSYPINHITSHHSDTKRVGATGQVKLTEETFWSQDHICRQIQISTLSLNPQYVFSYNIYQEVLDHYDGKCEIENVASTYFMKCNLPDSLATKAYDITINDFKKFAYYIATTDSNTEARKKFTLALPNETCMNDIKTHLLSKEKSYVVRTFDPETGKWSAEKIRN